MNGSVLVIDDQKIPRAAVSAILRDVGFRVQTAADGPEGIERARAEQPDVVVLDVNMPEMDGFAVVERLKQDPRTSAIPVIFLTAEVPTDDLVVRGLDLGAYDFLDKGCSPSELRARVAAMARMKRSHDELAALARLSAVVVQGFEPGELAQRLAAEVVGALRAQAGLLVFSPGDDGEEIRVGTGVSPDDPDYAAAIGDLHADMDDAEPDSTRGPEWWGDVRSARAQAGRFGTAVGVCIRTGGGRELLLAVLSDDVDARGEASDATLLTLLARQATLALENALLHAETRGQASTLEEQAESLEQAMAMRSRFFASMSHELRTPINAILGYSELLRDGLYGEMSGDQEEAVGRVVRSARHLLELVNDVLDVSRMEAGKLEVSAEQTDLAALVSDVAETLELHAREKGVEIRIDIPEQCEAVTDPARVRQILLNLLSNAVKFTDDGHVGVTLDDTGGQCCVRVTDTGPGIPPPDQERIFVEFEQTSAAAKRGGTGLGLAISRRLAELLGGSLELEQTSDAGSTFLLVLPREIPHDAADAGAEPETADAAG
jgi:signal transduction histidine kinase/FixJ family two-component response regulator